MNFLNTFNLLVILTGTVPMMMSIFYFYVFSRSRERFILVWGICWVSYMISVVFLALCGILGNSVFYDIKNIFDMFSILFFMYGISLFIGKKFPAFWLRFSLYLCIWVIVSVIYHFSASAYIPVSLYEAAVTVSSIYVVCRYWELNIIKKAALAVVFLLWSLWKAAAPFIEAGSASGAYLSVSWTYLIDFALSVTVIILTFIIYFNYMYTRMEKNYGIFHTITKNAEDVMFLYEYDRVPCFTYVSPSVEKMLGISPTAFYNDSKCYKDFVHPDDLEAFESLIEKTGKPENRHETLRFYDSDYRVLWCDIITTTIYHSNGHMQLEGIIRDITVIKEANEKLIAAKNERDIFLSYISHELKTPITSIIGFSSAIKDDDDMSKAQRNEMVDSIYNKALTLNKLVTDLVQLSKLETNQFSFEFSLISCSELASELRDRHLHDDDSEVFQFVFNDFEGRSLVADIDRIDLIFSNILTNAIRYRDPKRSIIINFGLDKKDDDFVFSVTNYGPVISKEDCAHIFDRFYRGPLSPYSSGGNNSGLGLTISKEIVQAHHGTIDAASSKRNGTVFTVALPLFDEEV